MGEQLSLLAYYKEIGPRFAFQEIRNRTVCAIRGHDWKHVEDWHCWDEGACAMIDQWWECRRCERFTWMKP